MSKAKQIGVNSLDELMKAVDDNKEKLLFVLFTGAADPASGESWCPDCVKADPVIERNLAHLPEDSVFVKCIVGDRPTWKDPQNEFRKHPKTLIKGIPTLLKWGTAERLGDSQCANDDLVKMLFTDE
ncbi:thioredoxin domain-containing protein 17-like [Tubulanus polymorphus]|uniref:thioredoxin domain-containing protein 17-like n=1 Tax=Tubulanus polymorphus TaxID=672921 RepID=UPI003DA3E8BA